MIITRKNSFELTDALMPMQIQPPAVTPLITAMRDGGALAGIGLQFLRGRLRAPAGVAGLGMRVAAENSFEATESVVPMAIMPNSLTPLASGSRNLRGLGDNGLDFPNVTDSSGASIFDTGVPPSGIDYSIFTGGAPSSTPAPATDQWVQPVGVTPQQTINDAAATLQPGQSTTVKMQDGSTVNIVGSATPPPTTTSLPDPNTLFKVGGQLLRYVAQGTGANLVYTAQPVPQTNMLLYLGLAALAFLALS